MAGSAREGQALAERLEARRPEIERTILTRVYGVSDPASVDDPQYAMGLRAAVCAALACGLDALGTSNGRLPSMPAELSTQARHAARNGVCLDTVLRRYFAGYALLCDFIVEETEGGGPIRGVELQRVLRDEAALLDRLVVAVTAAYTRETQERLPRSTEQRLAERVRGLLAGESVEDTGLGYELDVWHLAAIVTGPGARGAIRELAAALDRKLLAVRREGDTIWAWLGGRHRLGAEEAARLARGGRWAQMTLAIGEPGEGIDGWRLSHRQAKAAHQVTLRGGSPLVRYGDVALLASALSDELLAGSLRDAYLEPLAAAQDGGIALCETLGAYFRAGRNTSSAAAALGVSRKTVSVRLRAVEERIGRPLEGCAAELETALALRELARDDGLSV